jgi:hypothetical protein
MKKGIAVVIVFLLGILKSHGQQNTTYLGTSLSLHHEIRSRMIYGPGRVEKTSSTSFLGTGVRLQKKLGHDWGVNTGVTYVRRQYKMTVPFSYCSFLKPGEGCPYILAHASEFGYNTVEISLGVNKYLLERRKSGIYINLTYLVAFDFQSYYHSYIPAVGIKRINKTQIFSNSILSGFGYSYSLTENIKLIIEPFIRLVNTQRQDPILTTGYENKRTKFDNYGGHLLLMFRI